MNTLDLYFATFSDYPPIVNTKALEDEKYQELMLKAISRNEPLTPEELEEAFDGEEYDLVVKNNDIKENLKKIFQNQKK